MGKLSMKLNSNQFCHFCAKSLKPTHHNILFLCVWRTSRETMIQTTFSNASRRILSSRNIFFKLYSVNAEVELISRETIMPSTPTPPHLRAYKISLLDHLYANTHCPIFMYFKPTISTDDMIKNELPKFKKALSETISRFYPFAGRLNQDGRQIIECNDQGVVFRTTHVKNYTLSNFIENESKIGPQLGLFPMQPWAPPNEANNYALIAIQMNFFKCGGIGLSVVFSHKIIDAMTIGSFLQCLAGISSGRDTTIMPNYSASSLYPLRDSLPKDLFRVFFVESLLLKEGEKSVHKKFLFDAKAIKALKSTATGEEVPRPSRFEALTSFIWKRTMAADEKALNGQKRPSAVTFHVDLRRKMTPQLPKSTVGNLLWSVAAFCDKVENEKSDLSYLVGLFREELKKFNEFVPKSQGADGYDAICENLGRLKNVSSVPSLDAYLFTSWIGAGFYDVDFGWGKPEKIGYAGTIANLKLKNKIYLIESGNKDETIEALITLEPLKMEALENDPEFLAFAMPA